MQRDEICVCGHLQSFHRAYGCIGILSSPDAKKTERLFCQCKEFKARKVEEKRKEERTKLELELELATLRELPSYETYSTENTSRHGARIVSGKRWQLHEHVLVRLRFKNESKPARIAYCDTLPANAFAVGLQFPLAIDEWLVPDNDV